MTFEEILTQVQELLQREGRVAYRILKRRFALTDDDLEDLKADLIDAKRLAVDEEGKVLVWAGASLVSGSTFQVSSSQSPALSTQPPDARRQTPDARPNDAERRQLTVMFCDLVGSTALSAQLDPEELREVVRAYQETCTEAIRRYDGHIAQHLGDGLLVYFGYPAAHEDDAQRAVRVGLEIVEMLRTRSLSPSSAQPLQVRIGIHTGLVVIGEIGSSEKREILALGETPNIAARVQGQAAPDEVVISSATYRLVEGLFECEDRGRPELKGVPTSLALYRVVKEGEAQSRFQVVARKGLTPLVGREHEYGLLRERWARVKDGEGQVVLLSGEPGIGKSRLVEALKETVEHEGASCLELRCSPYAQNSALYPVIEHLQRELGFQQADSLDEKLSKLEIALGRRGGSETRPYSALSEAMPLFAALLSLPQPKEYPPLSLSPQKQKEKTHDAIVAWLCEEAKQRAVTYAWEDLHWADPSTLELLTLLLAQVPTTRLLAVLTHRPEFTPPWGVHSYISQLTLTRLGRTHVEMMVEKVTGGTALPPEVVQQIVSKTDGVPLFVEELTKSVMESVGALREAPLHVGIPVTLQDALMARLDRLGTTKEIAQVGATIGREFTYDLLRAVSPLNEETLQQGLRQLVEAELVYQSGAPPQARYLFKHALVQETAYQSLLKSRRQQLHQQVAQVLAEQFPETVKTQPELLAHHYTEAGLIEQAIPYWQQAGQRAMQRSADVEAERHLIKGLELLRRLLDTPERARQELALLHILGTSQQATKGWGAPEVEATYTLARELCQQIGETAQLFPVLIGLFNWYVVRTELQTSLELGEQLLSLAQSEQNPAFLVDAHRTLGITLFCLGDFTPSREHSEQGFTFYDPQQHSTLAFSHGQDPGVFCLANSAFAIWYLGYPDQALKRSLEALTLAERLAHPFSLSYALQVTATVHQLRGERQVAQERTEAFLTLSTEQEFLWYVGGGTMLWGWALAEQGQIEEGITRIRRGLAIYQATGSEVWRPYYLALLAEVYGNLGRLEEGLTVLAEALTAVDKTGQRFYEAELYRLKGELTLQKFQVSGFKFQVEDRLESSVQSLASGAEECFWKAIEIARRQQAKSLELRAAMSLARLWQQRGKKKEAHEMLSEIYGGLPRALTRKICKRRKHCWKNSHDSIVRRCWRPATLAQGSGRADCTGPVHWRHLHRPGRAKHAITLSRLLFAQP
jgi:class 3 adenylate cyclase/predicted ATPase